MGAPLTIEAATVSMADSLILMVIALVVFGPRKLPQIGRQVGKLMYEFRKASNDFKFQMEEELRNAEEADRRKSEEAERSKQQALNPPAEPTQAVAAESAAHEEDENGANLEDDNPYDIYSKYAQKQDDTATETGEGQVPEADIEPAAAEPAETATAPSETLPEAAKPAAEKPASSAATETQNG